MGMEDNINMVSVNKYKQHRSGVNNRQLEISPRDLPGGLA